MSAGVADRDERAGGRGAGRGAGGGGDDASSREDRPDDHVSAPAPVPGGPVGLGVRGWLRYLWRQLTSMRTALFLLMLLAVAAVPGSVIPQTNIDANQVATFTAEHPDLSPWLQRLGFFDVYASPWFSAIYLLLFVSLVGCVLPRSTLHLRTLRAAPPRTPARFERLPEHRHAELDPAAGRSGQDGQDGTGGSGQGADVDRVLAAAEKVLRARRYRVARYGSSFAGQRGELRETGNLLFHLSLVGVLIAVAVGGLYGYRGQAIVPVGKAFANSLVDYDSFDGGALYDTADLPPFRFVLDALRVQFETQATGNQFAAPRDFEGDVRIVDAPGDPERSSLLRVNSPLRVDGASVYLAGNGYAPVITVRDGEGNVKFSEQVPFLARDNFYTSDGVVKVPDLGDTQLGLAGTFYPTFDSSTGFPRSIFPDAGDPRLIFTAFTGDLGVDGGVPQNVYVLDTDDLTQMTDADGTPFSASLAPGEQVDLPDGQGSVAFERLDRFAGVTVRADPARGYALVFSLLAIVGLMASLFIPRRRVWLRVVGVTGEDGPRTLLEVGALARSEDQGLGDEADALLAAVLAEVGAGDRGGAGEGGEADATPAPADPRPSA